MRKTLVALAVLTLTSALGTSTAAAGAVGPRDHSATRVAASHHAFTSHPMIRVPGRARSARAGLPTISLNWSGYAATAASRFRYVHSRFVQPRLTCTGAPNRWTSNWVGLDGFTTPTVEQDGTFAWCGGKMNKSPQYVAWYELYPAPSVAVFRVHAGDVMDASVRFAGGKFTLTIADLTTGKKATHTAACSACQRNSAEWIVERPALCNNAQTKCFLTALADFHTSTMTQNTASVAGQAPRTVDKFANNPIEMIQPLKHGFISLDHVGPIGTSGGNFTVVWDRSGTTVPITL